jgi:hypothetical protein
VIAISVPGMRLTSPLNSAHNKKRWQLGADTGRRHKQAGTVFTLAMIEITRNKFDVSKCAGVRLIRIAPRRLDDDNNTAAFKWIRDAVAKALGVNDNHREGWWRPSQESQGPGVYGVRVELLEHGDE